jgi:hypothetical protein
MLERPQIFTIIFIAIGFFMKFVGEAVHEILGHGLFIILFDGKIIDVKISILWPYELSWIRWKSTVDFSKNELYLIQAGGILMCLLVSYVLQSYLFFQNKLDWKISSIFFWVSFWCYINSTGYLIIGGLAPFGDVSQLIYLRVLTSFSSTFFGVVLFLIGFLLLSKILRGILEQHIEKPSIGVIMFWFIIPIIVSTAILGHGFQLAIFPISFLPALFSFFWESRSHKNI